MFCYFDCVAVLKETHKTKSLLQSDGVVVGCWSLFWVRSCFDHSNVFFFHLGVESGNKKERKLQFFLYFFMVCRDKK